MPLSFHRLHLIRQRHGATIGQLDALYSEMDARYTDAARSYGFECRGCEDNCCRTRFHHHTLVEVLGLFAGYLKLPEDQRHHAARRARDYVQRPRADAHGRPLGECCPLNRDNRCLLYRERPMICRLHGVPHVLRHPVKGVLSGPGCHIFEGSGGRAGGQRLDRTPLYTAMASLEKALRNASGFALPIRLTVAEMVLCFEDPGEDAP